MAMNREMVKQRFNIIGNHPKLNHALDVAIQVAPTEVTVLVIGENGSGKDNFSKIIHQLSKRKHHPLISINCGAIPEGTIDSELFGHEKGSFTSAYEARKGYFEEANGGVVFLDEIAELPMPTQARLLRVLENGEFLRVGSSKVQKTDVRIIAATNKNLVEAIKQNKFREDLYFRLNTVTIYVPPLRERGEDIEIIFRFFTSFFAQKYGRTPLQLSEEAKKLLYQYHWPGNVRELRNFAEKLTVLVKENYITEEIMLAHLPAIESKTPAIITQVAPLQPISSTHYEPTTQTNGNTYGSELVPKQDYIIQALYELKTEVSVLKHALFSLLQNPIFQIGKDMYATSLPALPGGYSASGLSSVTAPNNSSNNIVHTTYATTPPKAQQVGPLCPTETISPLIEPIKKETNTSETLSLESNERDLIVKALEKHNQNRKKAANELGISERTLYRKIKILGLEANEKG
jgi:transcriptional regulator with PAS, ATPase and Fis domain